MAKVPETGFEQQLADLCCDRSQSYIEGVYSEVYPEKSEDEEGMQRFFKSETRAHTS